MNTCCGLLRVCCYLLDTHRGKAGWDYERKKAKKPVWIWNWLTKDNHVVLETIDHDFNHPRK